MRKASRPAGFSIFCNIGEIEVTISSVHFHSEGVKERY